MNTILVAEFDNELRKNIIGLLESEGYNTVGAVDGTSAIKYLESNTPDLIISDLALPVINGFDLLNYVQSHSIFSTIPFIVVTANADEENFRRGMNSGADDYLIKPFKSSDLLNTVRIRLHKRAKNMQQLEELKITLSKQIPHELRTPLVAILGFSDLIMSDIDTITKNELYQSARSIKKAGQRLHERIEKFLVYTEVEMLCRALKQIDEIKQSVLRVSQDVVDSELSNLLDRYERNNDVSINLEDADLCISERHFFILLTELVDNALKFSEAGTKIEICGYEENGIYTMKVVDRGSGFSQEHIKEISAFFQFNKDEMQQPGLGLGLAIVKKILEIFNGSLSIENIPGESTNINVSLPTSY